MQAAEPFDREAYEKDPQAYLDLIRPGRVFQSANPGKDVLPLRAVSDAYRELLQGESATLKVSASPGMPVTFHVLQLGELDNRLKTATVAASDDGVAQVRYRAVSGAVGQVKVLASSPVHSGRLKFVVDVRLPD